MSYASNDIGYSNQRITSIQQTVASFNGILCATQSLANELSGTAPGTVGAKLATYANTIYNGTTQGWIADRTRYLQSIAPAQGTVIIASPKTVFWSISPTYPVSTYGLKSNYSDTLAGWNIVTYVSSVALGLYVSGVPESIASYCGAGALGVKILSALTVSSNYYTIDVYNFCIWNTQYSFVCQYLWETPAIAQLVPRQCNGLYYILSSLNSSITYQQNQTNFEQQKQSCFGPLSGGSSLV